MKNSKRRGAVKVPNVILRPAQASSSRSNIRQTSIPCVGLHEDDGTDGAFDLTVGNKPFHGIVLCATGDLDKRTLFSRAQDLGATRSNDFTDQVTHLIADAPGSAKYKCAVERNLPILKSTWVDQAYQTWLNGDIVDLQQTICDHRLPMFSGIKLCITGMEDITVRNQIHSLLGKEGGVYLKSLDATVTHLLCCSSDNSAKLKWARDYNGPRSQANQIRIVWEEWFWDSMEFGGIWDESDYDITKARPGRKSLSQIPETIEKNTKILSTASFSRHAPLPCSVPKSTLLGDDPPEYGQTYKQRDVGLRIFQSIVQTRNHFESDNTSQCSKNNNIRLEQSITSPIVPNMKSQHENVLRPHSKRHNGATDINADSQSVLTRISNLRATSFARSSSPQPQSRQPFRSLVSSSAHAVPSQTSVLNGVLTSASSSNSRLFTGYRFRAFGEAKGPTLREALEEHGGQWLTEDEQDADFLIVRLVSGGMFWREEDDEDERVKYRTECWVERCIFEERICAPHEHVTFTPLKINTPVEGSENLHISLSGLDPAHTCWTKRLVRAIGGNLSLSFSRRSTHLVCPSGRGAKYDKAKEWGVSVVDMEWLIDIAISGKIPPTRELEEKHELDQAVPMDVDDKADQRTDVEGRTEEGGHVTIIDITNGALQESQPPMRTGTILDCNESAKEPNCPTPATRRVDSSPGLVGKPNALLPVTFPESPRAARKSGSTPPRRLGPSSWSSLATPKPMHTTRGLSAAEIEQDKLTTQIPSSHSPSPLKVPVKAYSMTSPPISETGGLRTAITALLGKRSVEAREESDGPQKPPSRSIKRPRLPSRVKTDMEPGRGLSPALSLVTKSPPLPDLSPHEGGVFSEEGQSSLRVVYEDPGQRAEKKKLIALFECTGPGDGKGAEKDLPNIDRARTGPKKKLVRRSTRSSGV